MLKRPSNSNFFRTRNELHFLCEAFPAHTNTKFGQKSFTQYGSSIWNKLDREVREIKNINNF